jgi:hypothetical protein
MRSTWGASLPRTDPTSSATCPLMTASTCAQSGVPTSALPLSATLPVSCAEAQLRTVSGGRKRLLGAPGCARVAPAGCGCAGGALVPLPWAPPLRLLLRPPAPALPPRPPPRPLPGSAAAGCFAASLLLLSPTTTAPFASTMAAPSVAAQAAAAAAMRVDACAMSGCRCFQACPSVSWASCFLRPSAPVPDADVKRCVAKDVTADDTTEQDAWNVHVQLRQ